MNLSSNQLTGTVPAVYTNGLYPVNVLLDGNDFGPGGTFQPAEGGPLAASVDPSASAPSGGGLSGGAIAGIVTGGEAGVARGCRMGL